jgi:ATP-dependent Zn protease
MDGFEQSDNAHVLVFAATNQKDKLDKAAIRKGRFDTHIYVGLPDIKKQHAILELYLAKKPFNLHSNPLKQREAIASIVELYKSHSLNPSPADLKGVVDEAARKAAITPCANAITHAMLQGAAKNHIAQLSKKPVSDYVL